MQNVQRVVFERDYRLVHEYYERGKTDMEDRKLYGQLKSWFEKKWDRPFVPAELKTGRNVF